MYGDRGQGSGGGMGGWLGAETQVSEDRPGERTGVGCTETARGSQCVVQESGTPDQECVQQSPSPPPKPHSQHIPKGRGGAHHSNPNLLACSQRVWLCLHKFWELSSTGRLPLGGGKAEILAVMQIYTASAHGPSKQNTSAWLVWQWLLWALRCRHTRVGPRSGLIP